VKLDIGRPTPQPLGESGHHIQRVKLVGIARDMQYSRLDGLVFVFFPIAWDPAANSKDTGHFAGMGRDESVVEPDRLGKAG
jgi:hypothetical protein